MTLWQESGHESKASMIAEVRKLLGQLSPRYEEMQSNERRFLEHIDANLERFEDDAVVTPKQLFWLRDLAQKY